jgi:hypothetical protein
MDARDLVALAATVAEAAGEILRGRVNVISETTLQAYWDASRLRQDDWAAAFKSYGLRLEQMPPGRSHEAWRPLRPVVDEILLSEPLTRVVSALLAQWDLESARRTAGPATDARPTRCQPFVHTVFLGHLEARHRALNLMVFGQGFSRAEGVMMNRLRRRCEHWSDLLLAALLWRCDISQYAVDPRRAERMAHDLGFLRADVTHSPTWPWIRASLRSSFPGSSAASPSSSPSSSPSAASAASPNVGRGAAWNRQIGASVLAWLQATSFDSWGIPQSSWITRLIEVADDVWVEPRRKTTESEGLSAPPHSPRLPLDRPNPDSHPHRFG